MKERLLGIPIYIAALGLLGLIVSVWLYPRGLGAATPDYTLGKSEVASRARAFAAAHGIDTSRSMVVVQTLDGGDDYDQLVARFGFDAVRDARAEGRLPLATWRARFRHSVNFDDDDEDPGALVLTLDQRGTVIAADFLSLEANGNAPPREEARRIAAEQLAAFGIDLSGYEERTDKAKFVVSSGGKGDGDIVIETDEDEPPNQPKAPEPDDADKKRQRFTWESADPVWSDVKRTVSATVTAAGVSAFSSKISQQNAPIAPGLVGRIVEGVVSFVFLDSFLVITLLGILLSRLIARDYVSITRAIVVAGVVIAAALLAGVISTPLSSSVFGLGVALFFLSLFLAIVIAPAWLAGEADAYFAWGQRSTESAVALLNGAARARQVARSVLEGYLWGFGMLGVLAAAAAGLVAKWGPGTVHGRTDMFALDAHPVSLFWIGVLPYVLIFGVLGLLFYPAWLHRITRRMWIAIPLGAAVAGMLASQFSLIGVRFGELPPSLSWGLGLGVVTCVLVLRRDWLTAVVATFAFSAFYYGLAPVTLGATSDAVAAGLGLALIAVPPVAAFVAAPRLSDVQVREAPPPRISKIMELARREEELNIARRVQSILLPREDPDVVGFEIAGTCLPANEVGGDYFDYFQFTDGRFGIAVGDVSGKGVPAAFCMTLTKGFMEVAVFEAREPDIVLMRANKHLRDNLARDTFVTMTYAVLDPESGAVTCARAGHNPPAIVREGAAPEFVNPSGTALGAATEERFAEIIEPCRLELERGDTLVFYTDGVTEAMNASREQFGEQRLLDTLERLRDGRSARGMVEALLGEIDRHARDADQHDDITIVVVKAA